MFVGKSGSYQNCFLLHCVLKLCTLVSTLTVDEWFLQFSGLGFVTLDTFHCVFVFACVL